MSNLKEGEDFYYSEEGYMVFTAKYHLKKGYCCGYGCRHCPYEYENVPEPRKSECIKQRTNDASPLNENS